MFKLTSFTIFFILSTHSYSQLTRLEDLDSIKFNNYVIFFIGEQHLSDFKEIEMKILNKINLQNSHVFLEEPYYLNLIFKDIYKNRNLNEHSFVEITSVKYEQGFYDFLFKKSVSVSGINTIYSNYFPKKFIFDCYDTLKDIPKLVSKDLKLLNNIGHKIYKPKSIRRAQIFINSYNKNMELNKMILGSKYKFINECVQGIKTAVNIYNDTSKNATKACSNYRENYLFENVKRKIDEVNCERYISINGGHHVSLDSNTNHGVYLWKSLALKSKQYYLNRKVCSIYILELNNDEYFKVKFPDAYDYFSKSLMDKTSTYIVDLENTDLENTDFEKLKDSYTYIVIFNRLGQ